MDMRSVSYFRGLARYISVLKLKNVNSTENSKRACISMEVRNDQSLTNTCMDATKTFNMRAITRICVKTTMKYGKHMCEHYSKAICSPARTIDKSDSITTRCANYGEHHSTAKLV